MGVDALPRLLDMRQSYDVRLHKPAFSDWWIKQQTRYNVTKVFPPSYYFRPHSVPGANQFAAEFKALVTTVWIVEKSTDEAPAVALSLMGTFAVRVVGSLESLATLARLCRRTPPDAVLFDHESLGTLSIQEIERFASQCLPEVPCIITGPASNTAPRAAHVLEKPVDPMALASLVRTRADPAGKSLRHRDLMLRIERLEAVVLPINRTINLTVKEAQLLRLLLEQPGRCLSRDEIKSRVWGAVSVTERTIDTHVSRLRRRIEDTEVTIEAVYGGGYVLR